MNDTHDVTTLLNAWAGGDAAALEHVLGLLEAQLRLLAHRYVGRNNRDETLRATALVHEVLIRFIERVNRGKAHWENREHFIAHVALSMRSLLADRARAGHAHKRGADAIHISFNDVDVADPRASRYALLYVALDRLGHALPAAHHAFVYRRIVGLSTDEAAALLGVHRTTVMAHLRLATAFLEREIGRIPESTALSTVESLERERSDAR